MSVRVSPAPPDAAARLEQSERRVERLRATLAVQREVTAAAGDRGSALRVVADRAVELFPSADGAAVELSEGAHLTYAATAGTLAPFAGQRIAIAGSLSGQVLDEDRLARSRDTAGDRRVDRAACKRLGIGSMIVAPLHADREIIGVLKICAAARDAFDDVDEQQLELLADSLASALQHADDAARAAKLLRERTDALAALEVSERRFRLTFENSPTGLILSGLEPHNSGRYLQANPAMTTITGYSAAELVRMTFADLQHPDDVASSKAVIAQLISGELDTVTIERRYRHKDGHTVWVSVRAAVIRDERGNGRYVVNQIEDITARRDADIQLRRQARLLELIPAAVIVRNLDGTIRWCNTSAEQLYGWPLAIALGKVTHRLLGTVFPGGISPDEHRAILERDGRWEGQLGHGTADGRAVTVLSRHIVHREPGDALVLEINTDVTAARAAAEALAESEQRLRAQFSNAAVGQIVRALDGRMLDVNPAYARMIGRSVEEVTALTETALLNPADVWDGRHRMAGLMTGEIAAYTREERLWHSGGYWVTVESTISLLRDPDGRPKHIIGVVTDISDRRAAERARDQAAAELAERNTELEAANALKIDLLGMLGHEIGNPLTSIRGNAEILVDDWAELSDDRRQRAIGAIARQADRLDEIVREVLAMVTIEAGALRADRRPLHLRTEIDRALLAADVPRLPVRGDDATVLFHAGHLQQILVNLLSNAAKYGGGATGITVTALDGEIRVDVEDSGPGVPEEFRHRLFQRLARADRDAVTVRGTGLGLYIVRGLAQANHGDMHYRPNPAGGSIFSLDLQTDL